VNPLGRRPAISFVRGYPTQLCVGAAFGGATQPQKITMGLVQKAQFDIGPSTHRV
jgi:hypothetical protein